MCCLSFAFCEQNRAQLKARRESDAHDAKMNKADRKVAREVGGWLDALLKTVSKTVGQEEREANKEAKEKAKEARERAKEEAKEAREKEKQEIKEAKEKAKEQARQDELERKAAFKETKEREKAEKKGTKSEMEIQRVLDRLVARLEKDEDRDEKQRQKDDKKAVRKSLEGFRAGKPLESRMSIDPEDEVELFCVCQKPYNPAFTMICCDICESWYHGKCVGLTSVQVDAIEEYVCPNCREKTGQRSSWKQGIEVSATSHRLPKALAGPNYVNYSKAKTPKAPPSPVNDGPLPDGSYPRVLLKMAYPRVVLTMRKEDLGGREDLDSPDRFGVSDEPPEPPPIADGEAGSVMSSDMPMADGEDGAEDGEVEDAVMALEAQAVGDSDEDAAGPSDAGGASTPPAFGTDDDGMRRGRSSGHPPSSLPPSLPCSPPGSPGPDDLPPDDPPPPAPPPALSGAPAAPTGGLNAPVAADAPSGSHLIDSASSVASTASNATQAGAAEAVTPATHSMAASGSASAPYSLVGAFRVDGEAEIALSDPGMQGSWYPCTIDELAGGEGNARVRVPGLCDDAGGSDPAREYTPLRRLRPPPPPTPAEFVSGLSDGGLAELWRHSGWWQVIVRQVPGGTPCHGSGRTGRGAAAVAAIAAAAAIAEGGAQPSETPTNGEGAHGGCTDEKRSSWVLESLQFGEKHRVAQPTLRPCWRWSASDQGADPIWSIVERLPEPPPPPPPQTQRSDKNRQPASAPAGSAPGSGGSGGGGSSESRKAAKRKTTEPLGAGSKELKREEAQRENRELMGGIFAEGKQVEVRDSPRTPACYRLLPPFSAL